LVRDLQGSKMSKSLGNSPDPTQVMKQFGADALRFTMTMLSPQGQDVYYSNEKVELGRNFCNKIWNATRFVFSNLPEKGEGREAKAESGGLELADRWILSRLNQTIRALTNSLQEYRFDEAAHCIYDFFWHEYCDWYLELIKPRLCQSSAEKGSKSARRLAAKVLRVSMQLLHPFMPFISEDIWHRLNAGENGTSIMISSWPQCDQQAVDETAEKEMFLLQEFIVAIRNIRAEMNIPPDRKADVMVRVSDKGSLRLIQNHEGYITNLAKAQNLCAGPEVNKPHQHCATAVVKGMEVFVPLAGLIDLDRERERLEREVERLSEQLKRLCGRLEDGNFLKKAPAEVVKKERQKHLDCRENLEKLLVNLRALGKVQGNKGAGEQRGREKIRDI
ncbi:MAG: class I tRNA ligase family protein, partial [Candidatus Latescibacteria bacterium]|nr:class I tRNA ligase family protein [Candidatus Latescibacterota bacterium]